MEVLRKIIRAIILAATFDRWVHEDLFSALRGGAAVLLSLRNRPHVKHVYLVVLHIIDELEDIDFRWPADFSIGR